MGYKQISGKKINKPNCTSIKKGKNVIYLRDSITSGRGRI